MKVTDCLYQPSQVSGSKWVTADLKNCLGQLWQNSHQQPLRYHLGRNQKFPHKVFPNLTESQTYGFLICVLNLAIKLNQ